MATTYLLTGVDCDGRRFRKQSDNAYYLSCHNVWRGNLWEVDMETGKRRKIKSWLN